MSDDAHFKPDKPLKEENNNLIYLKTKAIDTSCPV